MSNFDPPQEQYQHNVLTLVSDKFYQATVVTMLTDKGSVFYQAENKDWVEMDIKVHAVSLPKSALASQQEGSNE